MKKNSNSKHRKKPDKADTVEKRIAKSKKNFLVAFENTAANISAACKAVGISRETYYQWYDKDKDFAAKCDEIRQSLIDAAETQLMINVRKGKEASLFFFLCNRAPDRWKNIQRIEHSGKIDAPPSTNIIQVLSEVEPKSGRPIGELLNEAIEKTERIAE